MKVMILAGGGGTRLWPLSRQRFPKQFLSLFPGEELSLLSATIKRAIETVNGQVDNVYVSTSEQLLEPVLSDLQNAGFDESLHHNVLLEPCMRNTGPAIAFMARYILDHAAVDIDSEVLAILPADHHIADVSDFASKLQQAETLAKKGYIVTLGIMPDRPETGYGYIEMEDARQPEGWHNVLRFVEKPSLEKAEEYLASKRYLWNAGIFVLSFKTLLSSLEAHCPDIHQILKQGYQASRDQYPQMPNISFDYAVMEHSKNTAVIPLLSQWSDIGSWDSLHAILPKDNAHNATSEPETTIFHNSQNCLVQSLNHRRINMLGMQDCFVVDTPDALLVGHLDASQDVKSIVAELAQINHGSVARPTVTSQPWGNVLRLNAEAQNEVPVYRLTVKAGKTISVSAPSTCSLQVLGGVALLQHGGLQKNIAYPDMHLVDDGVALLQAVDGDLNCLLVGELPTIQSFHDRLPFVQEATPSIGDIPALAQR